MDEDKFDGVDEGFKDFNESDINEFKINPSYYLHTAILKSQECLISPDMKEGLLRFQFAVLHLESLCKASNLIDPSYNEDIEKFVNSKEYTDADKSNQRTILAIKKQELLTTYIFRNRTLTSPIELV